jgi:hypothetical protein
VNEGVANTLRSLDGAERAFWDATTGGNVEEGGWFGKAADYMESSINENWPEVDKDQVVGNLVYNLGHITPFFGEMMITPKIGKIGQLENLLTTKGFATAYGDADVRRDMGLESKPLLEGLQGAGMGLKDALAFHLLGYGASNFGKVVSDVARSGDVGVGASMMANGLGFGAYSSLSEYLQTGEVSDGTFGENFVLGIGLGAPAMMQSLGNRAINTYYGVHPVNAARVRKLPLNVVELRDIEYSLLEQARNTEGVNNKFKLISQAKAFNSAANFKAYEMVVVRDPEGTIKSINENKNLSESQRAKMIQRVQESTLNAEVDAINLESSKTPQTKPESNDLPLSDTNIPPKGESALKESIEPSNEVSELGKVMQRRTERDQKGIDLLDKVEKEGGSADFNEAYANLSEATKKEVDADPFLKREVVPEGVKGESISSLKADLNTMIEQRGKKIEAERVVKQEKKAETTKEGVKAEEPKTETDGKVPEQAAEKLDVEEQPKVSKEDGKGDTKEGESKPPRGS